MKTLFSFGFQSYNPFSMQHPSLGQGTTENEQLAYETAELRKNLTSIIADGNKKLATVKAWVGARINQDPTLVKSFGGDQVVADNFSSFSDMVTKDQYYADLAAQKIASDDPVNYEFSEELLGRVDEWSKGIDILFNGIQQYGGGTPIKPMPVKTGPMGPITNPKTGTVVRSSIAPGASIKTAPAPSSGVSTNTLLIGGGIVAAAIAVILAMRA